jgi:hypothetical protein
MTGGLHPDRSAIDRNRNEPAPMSPGPGNGRRPRGDDGQHLLPQVGELIRFGAAVGPDLELHRVSLRNAPVDYRH